MTLNIAKEVAAMQRMTGGQLRDKYADVFGEQPRSRHKDWRTPTTASAESNVG